MFERNVDILKSIPAKQSTNKSIQKVVDDEEISTCCLKKCVTTSMKSGRKDSSYKRINTCLNVSIKDKSLLKLMSEHVYALAGLKKPDESEESDDDCEEIKTTNRNYKLKTRTLVKIGTKFRSKIDKSLLIQTSIEEETKVVEEEDSVFGFERAEVETAKIESQNKCKVEEDSILENLLSKYYYDIADNVDGNFEDYAVNNLTIISYLDKIIMKSHPIPKLSEETLHIVKSFDRTKKILILDLDETLIHSDFNGDYEYFDAEIIVKVDNLTQCFLKILIRPFTTEFLEFAKEHFNLVLFTASMQDYADAIVNYIDPLDEFFKLRLYRESCLEFKNFFIKDLSIFETFGLKDMIIVDNCLYSFARNLKNGILIPSFYSDSEDRQLLVVKEYLETKMIDTKDIREVNESYYGLESIKNFLYEKLEKEGLIS